MGTLTLFGPVILLLLLMGAMFLTVSAKRLSGICFKWALIITAVKLFIDFFGGRLPW